ncbi:hypothetical protein EGT07_13130 [Herbaspirillum sp. HC18]|nr:hypothetical protein EGT07_13130 [Herbaspirillum sp. HC18]
MFAASLSHQVRPVGVLLGGSGICRAVEQKTPEVGALLKPRTDLCVSRPLPWKVDRNDLSHEQASASMTAPEECEC